MYVATSRQLKQYDQALLDLGYTIEELVDKASNAIIIHMGQYKKIAVVCGPGNNGADGISLALKLFEKGVKVKMFIIGEFDHLSQANQFYLERAKEVSLPTTFLDQGALPLFERQVSEADVVVDAMFGFGLNSDLRGVVKNTVDIINNLYDVEIVAIDIPTGLNPDTGIPYNSCICATKTITLTALKLAFLNEETHMYTGDIALETLDTKDVREEMGIAKLMSSSWVKYNLKPRLYYGHKGDYGRIMHITGCDHYRGAALMASKASVYTGSGIVTVCSSQKVIEALAIENPECTSLLRLSTFDDEDLAGKDALLIGSGLGLNKDSYDLVNHLVKTVEIPMVIDGDALTILSQNKDVLKNHLGPLILTPHHGEFKRFVDFENESEMVEKANQFASEYNVTLVLKGPNTIICDGEEMYRNITANKAMATAGMGDVLAGMIVSFVGQGYNMMKASMLATYIHGLCGDEIAAMNYTVIPTELIKLIPRKMFDIINH